MIASLIADTKWKITGLLATQNNFLAGIHNPDRSSPIVSG